MLDPLRKRFESKEENDIEYMDTADQIKMINSMRQENEDSNRTFRRIFFFFALTGCVVKLYACLMQYLFPYTFLFHMALYDLVPAEMIVASEFVGALTFFPVAYFINRPEFSDAGRQEVKVGGDATPVIPRMTDKKKKYSLLGGFVISSLMGLYWYFGLGAQSVVFSTWFGWFSSLLAIICYNLEQSIIQTDSEILELYSHTYNFKTI